jgi:hypothetical protein
VRAQSPTWTALLFLSTVLYFNVSGIVFFIFPVGKVIIFPARVMAAIVCVPILAVNYFIFIRKDKCMEIIEEFENESRTHKVWSTVLVMLYIVLTLLFAHWKHK